MFYRVDEKYVTNPKSKIYLKFFDFFQKPFAIRTGKGLQKIYIFRKNYFKIIPGLFRAQKSEVVKSSPRGICKITDKFEKYPQQMVLMV